jgi:hypothetical protein
VKASVVNETRLFLRLSTSVPLLLLVTASYSPLMMCSVTRSRYRPPCPSCENKVDSPTHDTFRRSKCPEQLDKKVRVLGCDAGATNRPLSSCLQVASSLGLTSTSLAVLLT